MTTYRYGLAGLAGLGLAACGQGFSPASSPGVPCPEISAAEFAAFSKTGAAKAVVTVDADGAASMKSGPGAAQCASGKKDRGPCLRPNPLVIQYNFANGSTTHVRVPAETEYRFREDAQPTSCEIITGGGAPA